MVSEDFILFVRANMRIITRTFFSENVRYAQKNYVVFLQRVRIARNAERCTS